MPTLSQRLGSFPTKSRAENFPLCRRDWLDGLREEKIGSKNRKKPASSPVFSAASLSLYTLSPPCSQRLQATLPPARLSPSPPHLSLSTERSSFFLHGGSSQSTPPFSFYSFSSIGSSSTDSSTDAATSFRETTQTTSNLTPDQWQQLLLLRKVVSHFTPQSATAKLHAERELTVHVLQLIHPSLGPGQLWPSPNVWLGLARPQKKRRKKICWAEIGPTVSWVSLGPVTRASPTHLF